MTEQDRPLPPLYGRDVETGQLAAAVSGVSAGTGGCFVVTGAAGLGKSRLLDHVAGLARSAGVAVGVGKATDLDRVAPLTTLMTAVQRVGPRPLDLADAGVWEAGQFWQIDRLGAAIEQYARSQPLLLAVDDAHCTDELSALALRILVPALSSFPVLWLLARRPVPTGTPAQGSVDWLIADGAREIVLPPLDESAVEQLCTQVLGAEVDATVLTVASRGGGNPFLIEQLMGTLDRAGQVLVADGTATIVGNELPSSFIDAVDHRLRGLSGDARLLLQVGAVLGNPFSAHVAALLLRRPAAQFMAAVEEAVASGTLADSGTELAFRHDLLREAVYNRMSGSVRSMLHREAADVLRAEGRNVVQVADHLARSGQPGGQAAAQVLREAAAEVAGRAPSTAADLICRAVETLDDADRHPDLAAEAVRLLASAGRLAEARTRGEAALRAGLDPPTEARLLLGLAEALKHAGDNRAVVELTGRGLALGGVPDAVRAQLLAVRAHALLISDLPAADQAATQAHELGQATGEHEASVFGLTARSVVARARGHVEEALAHAGQAVELARLDGGPAAHRHPGIWYGSALAAADRFAEAEAAYLEGQREAERLGTAWSLPLWHYYRSVLFLDSGRLDDVEAETEAGLLIADQLGAVQLSVPLLSVLSRVAVLRGQIPQARQALRRAERLVGRGVSVAPEDLQWATALVEDATGDAGSAARTLADVYAGLADRMLLLTRDATAAAVLVRLAMSTGHRARADAAVGVADDIARANPGISSLVGAAAHATGLRRRDLASLRRAVAAFRASPRPLALASALEDTGVAEQRVGSRQRAVAHWQEAVEVYRRCAAHREVRRVEGRLRGAGAASRSTGERAEESPLRELTEAELRVVRLVAQGATNREVAERLFLSPHTVDSHLRHVFAKLQVNSRVELTRVVVMREAAAEAG